MNRHSPTCCQCRLIEGVLEGCSASTFCPYDIRLLPTRNSRGKFDRSKNFPNCMWFRTTHGETTTRHVRIAAAAGRITRTRYFHIASNPKGSDSMTTDVLTSAAAASSAAVPIQRRTESDSHMRSRHQNRAATNIAVNVVSQTLLI